MAKKILIADDSKAFQFLEKTLLSGAGYEVINAYDGAQAIKLALEHVPDLVLLDVQMPVMDGVQALAFLRKDAKTKHLPIVIVTTIARQEDRRLLLAGGATAFLEKPIHGPALTRLVRELIGPPG